MDSRFSVEISDIKGEHMHLALHHTLTEYYYFKWHQNSELESITKGQKELQRNPKSNPIVLLLLAKQYWYCYSQNILDIHLLYVKASNYVNIIRISDSQGKKIQKCSPKHFIIYIFFKMLSKNSITFHWTENTSINSCYTFVFL